MPLSQRTRSAPLTRTQPMWSSVATPAPRRSAPSCGLGLIASTPACATDGVLDVVADVIGVIARRRGGTLRTLDYSGGLRGQVAATGEGRNDELDAAVCRRDCSACWLHRSSCADFAADKERRQAAGSHDEGAGEGALSLGGRDFELRQPGYEAAD